MASSNIQEYNFAVYQGSSFSITFSLTDSDDSASDLTGYGVRGVVKHRYGDTSSILSLNPSIVAPATDGKVSVSILASQTTGLAVGQMVYDIEKYLLADTDTVSKVVKGYFNVSPEVTT